MNIQEFWQKVESRIRLAQAYGARGLPVFPVWPPRFDGSDRDGKVPAIRAWEEKALTDSESIWRLWQEFATPRGLALGRIMSIGIPTGRGNLTVLDEDPRHGGNLLDLPLTFDDRQTVAVDTPSGGTHLYYRTPSGITIPSSVGAIAPGIDVRADGALVIAPDSFHKSQKHYQFKPDQSPFETEILPLPPAIVGLILAKSGKSRDIGIGGEAQRRSAPKITGNILEGQRHDQLVSLAGTMRRRGMTTEAIEAALLVENQIRCTPPLEDDEVRRIAKSMQKYDPEDVQPPPKNVAMPEPKTLTEQFLETHKRG